MIFSIERCEDQDGISCNVRMRSLRSSEAMRPAECWFGKRILTLRTDWIYPVLRVWKETRRRSIRPSMPGVYHFSLDLLGGRAARGYEAGIRAVLLFGVPDRKDASELPLYDQMGSFRRQPGDQGKFNELLVIADTCLCQLPIMVIVASSAGADGRLLNRQ